MSTLYTVQVQAEHLNINVLRVIKKNKLIYWFKKDFKFKLSTTCRAGLGGACKGNRTSSAENRHNTHLNDGEACCYLNLQDCTILYQMWGTGHFREFPTGMSCSGGGRGRRRGQGEGGGRPDRLKWALIPQAWLQHGLGIKWHVGFGRLLNAAGTLTYFCFFFIVLWLLVKIWNIFLISGMTAQVRHFLDSCCVVCFCI